MCNNEDGKSQLRIQLTEADEVLNANNLEFCPQQKSV